MITTVYKLGLTAALQVPIHFQLAIYNSNLNLVAGQDKI